MIGVRGVVVGQGAKVHAQLTGDQQQERTLCGYQLGARDPASPARVDCRNCLDEMDVLEAAMRRARRVP